MDAHCHRCNASGAAGVPGPRVVASSVSAFDARRRAEGTRLDAYITDFPSEADARNVGDALLDQGSITVSDVGVGTIAVGAPVEQSSLDLTPLQLGTPACLCAPFGGARDWLLLCCFFFVSLSEALFGLATAFAPHRHHRWSGRWRRLFARRR